MNVAIPPKITGLEFCAGIGMLGESVRAALRFFGYQYQTVCYVEREAAAAAQLVTLMEAGAIDPAPIWSDILTFAGRRWRGIVDLLIAGFPCQDISLAGKGRGLDGDRSGLIFDILDDADDCGATGLFLENVAAIASANATVVDEAEEVIERAASRVLGELADRGWHSEWITISASDVGASHGRARWFCLAWRNVANPDNDGRERCRLPAAKEWIKHGDSIWDGEDVGNTDSQREQQPDNPECTNAWEGSRIGTSRTGMHLADASRSGLQGREWRGPSDERHGPSASGPATQLCEVLLADPVSIGQHARRTTDQRDDRAVFSSDSEYGVFAPGPQCDRWSAIVAHHPHLAPATEPRIRVLADGLALVVDESRNHQLRQAGNGVVALQAATAFVVLARRAGLFQ